MNKNEKEKVKWRLLRKRERKKKKEKKKNIIGPRYSFLKNLIEFETIYLIELSKKEFQLVPFIVNKNTFVIKYGPAL